MRTLRLLAALLALSALTLPTTFARAPHIVLVLADDLGWANVNWHRNKTPKEDKKQASYEVRTPNMDALIKKGTILDRFYAYKICSPTRSSIQSGRLPVHVNELNLAPETHNPKDLIGGYAGVPPKMTSIASRLKSLGYKTVISGKWDAGMAHYDQTPMGSGYDSALFYFHHANDYWTCGINLFAIGEIDVCKNKFTDLWLNHGPARKLAGTAYEEDLFLKHSLDEINKHDPNVPLFLFHSHHIVHTPLQIAPKFLRNFTDVEHLGRRKYAAMVHWMDSAVGHLQRALEAKHMWDDTLLVFLSDNGGPLYTPASANNHPLRAGKYSDFEGGVRVNAFVSGGHLPSSRRKGERLGKKTHVLHVSDLYPTFINAAREGLGLKQLEKISDQPAVRVGLPDVDGHNQWAFLSGKQSSSKRTSIHLSSQAFLDGEYKIVLGTQRSDLWTGPFYPNKTGSEPPFPDLFPHPPKWTSDCGSKGCLFNVFSDQTEHVDLADSKPELLNKMRAQLLTANLNNFKPDRGTPDERACEVASRKYHGFYGPFLGLPKDFVELKEDDVSVSKA